MSRSAYFGKEAQDALVAGLNHVADAVKSTLGPAGKTVVLQRKEKSPVVSKDGISVAKTISPKDEKVKLGADLAISIAQKQMDAVGDGTTTATVLGQALVNAGVRALGIEDNVNRTSFRKGIEKVKDYLISELDSLSTKIEDHKQLVNIATVSANGDEKLGNIVAEAYEKVGKAGVVLVEETSDREVHLDFKEGMTFNKGWVSQYFVTNHADQTVEYDNPFIVLCEGKISSFTSMVQVLNNVYTQAPVVVMAESFDPSVTQAVALNTIQSGGQIKIALVEAPGFAQRRLDILRDIAIYTGGEVGNDPMSVSFEAMSTADFGRCEKIIIKKDETIIRGGKGKEEDIKARIESIEGLIGACKENDTYEKEQLGKRLASLTTGVAVIQVGGSSEEEIKELKDRLDDAQYAVKSALEEGYLPGAGNTLLLLSNKIQNEVKGDNEAEELAIKVFANALKAPFRTILTNAGISYDFIEKEIIAKNDVKIGYNARTLEVTNLLEDGIIDPTKVVKGTVYVASSIAGVVLTSSVIITEDPVENNNPALSLNMMPSMM